MHDEHPDRPDSPDSPEDLSADSPSPPEGEHWPPALRALLQDLQRRLKILERQKRAIAKRWGQGWIESYLPANPAPPA